MGLELGSSGEDSEAGIGQAPEKVSEKSREQSSSKALAGIAKTKKDEAKGRKASDLLSAVLVKILRNPEFDVLLDPVTKLMRMDLPSPYVVGMLSLVSLEASNAVRKTYDPEWTLLSNDPEPETEITDFDPARLRQDFRDRINAWIGDIFLVCSKDPSSILTEKFLSEISRSDMREAFVAASESVLSFFFHAKNVRIPSHEARSLSFFLIRELETKLSELSEKFDRD